LQHKSRQPFKTYTTRLSQTSLAFSKAP